MVVVGDRNVSHDLQAQDRAFRLGQTKDTEVYRFVSAGTIEETMYQRQIYKQQLANICMEAKNEKRCTSPASPISKGQR
jgi:SNF2 family DNA or RNA helicase